MHTYACTWTDSITMHWSVPYTFKCMYVRTYRSQADACMHAYSLVGCPLLPLQPHKILATGSSRGQHATLTMYVPYVVYITWTLHSLHVCIPRIEKVECGQVSRELLPQMLRIAANVVVKVAVICVQYLHLFHACFDHLWVTMPNCREWEGGET